MRGTASLTVERVHAGGVIAAFICMFGAGLARAQDMEPRAYSAVPIDTNFLIGTYQRTTGAVARLVGGSPFLTSGPRVNQAFSLTTAPSLCSGTRGQ